MLSTVKQVVTEHEHQPSRLLEILRCLQTSTNYLAEETIIQVAKELDVPISQVYGVATFYSMYSTKPRGKYVIRFCESAPCHIEGAAEVLAAIQGILGVDVDETTDNGKFSLELTSCLGVCGVAPAMMINSTVYGNLTPKKVQEVLMTLE